MTTTCEQYLHPAAVAEAALASGIRCVLTPGVFDMPGSMRRVPGRGIWPKPAGSSTRWTGATGRLHVGFGPHAAYSLPPAGLSAVAEEAQRRGAMIQIHLAETEAEGQVVEERYGMRAPALLASLGVFDGPVLAAHAVWLDDADMDVMAEHDVAVAHCPGSNGKLGSGVARLRRAAGPGDPGRPGHRRARIQRRSPSVGRDAPGRHIWPGPPRPIRLPSARRPPCGWPPGAGARRSGSPSARSRPGARRTSSACAPTTPASSRRINEAELLGHLVWAGAGYLVTDVWVGGAAVVVGGECVQIDAERARVRGGGSGLIAFLPLKLDRYGRFRRSGSTARACRRRGGRGRVVAA